MAGELDQLYSPVIREHANRPRHRGRLAGANRRASAKNPLCGDWVAVYLRVEGGVVQEAGFESFGCALCRASASLLTEAVRGRSVGAVRELVDWIETLVGEGRADGDGAEELRVLAAVRGAPARIRCVLLPWRTLAAAMGEPGALT